MVTKYGIVLFVMEVSEKPAQNQKKKRSESEKVGRLKYIIELLKRLEVKADSMQRRLSRIEAHYKRSLVFEKSDIENVCADEVDKEIVRLLFEAGNSGLLPKVLAEQLKDYKITRFQVSRRILRMNKRLQQALEESVAEQRGWHWALTSFAFDAWGVGSEKIECKEEQLFDVKI